MGSVMNITPAKKKTTFLTKAIAPIFESTQFSAPAASNTTIKTDFGTQITFLELGGWSSSQNIIPADATSKNQYELLTYVNPNISTDGASHTCLQTQLTWDNAGLGYGNINGNLVTVANAFYINSDGNINYASVNSNYAQFANDSITQQFKGLTSDQSLGTNATINDCYGVVTGLNTTSGTVAAYTGYSQYSNFTDSSIGNVNGLNSGAGGGTNL